jgi:hypothetical protein
MVADSQLIPENKNISINEGEIISQTMQKLYYTIFPTVDACEISRAFSSIAATAAARQR